MNKVKRERESTFLNNVNKLIITIAARQALGMNLINSINKNKHVMMISAEISVFTGVLDPMLSIKEHRLSEPEGEYAEKKDPAIPPLPNAISSWFSSIL